MYDNDAEERRIRVHPSLEEQLKAIRRRIEEKNKKLGLNRPVFQNETSFIAAKILENKLNHLNFLIDLENKRKRTRLSIEKKKRRR